MKTLMLTLCALFAAQTLQARPTERPELAPSPGFVDVVGDVDATQPSVAKAAIDTTWIATWNFEGCDETGWVRADNRILNDGNIYWQVNNDYAGIANIVDDAAAVFSIDLCSPCVSGYRNSWIQGIRLLYVGDSYLSFDYLVDTEGGFDFLQVETDSACTSFSMVDYEVNPTRAAMSFRDLAWSTSGFDTTTARRDSLILPGYSSADTHCAYFTFFSDYAYSCGDGLQPTVLGAGAVIDNILLEGAHPQSEDFASFVPSADLQFVNLQDSEPFGAWARTYQHITDSDVCTENLTCAWLATDNTTPTLASDPSMAFAPGGYVIKNWLDETLTGPWVSLSSTADAVATFMQLHRFGGNSFSGSRIVQNWSIRGRTRVANTESPAPGDSVDCISAWGHAAQWNSLDAFYWQTLTFDATNDFDPASSHIQVRFRLSDWQWIFGATPPSPFGMGPGPFWDRVRLGRQILTGPVIDEGIDARDQAQDAAPNDPTHEAGPLYAQATGPQELFGSTAFSRSADLGTGYHTANLIVGDSITVEVEDILGAGIGVIEFHASIVAGPHAGKSPAPYPVGPNGFFSVPVDSCRTSSGNLVADRYFVDLDDTYFRGGDCLRYFWWATDLLGGANSLPHGMNALPADLQQAELQTGGLFEVNFLPTINWDAAYLARIAADTHGDLDPTPQEITNSTQANCILYYHNVNKRRRSGDLNRTSFMYTLDKLGYRGAYDVYDHMGLGNTNNQLGSRMSPDQARLYSLVVYDAGNLDTVAPILPDGTNIGNGKIDMSTWFQSWNSLSGGLNPEHTLWILGPNVLEDSPNDPLYASMGVSFVTANQAQDPNPDVIGVANFTTHTACNQTHVGDQFALQGGCPEPRDYDNIAAIGSGVLTHVYGKGSPSAAGAVVMNAHAGGYTTIASSFPWFDIRAGTGQGPTTADEDLLAMVLSCALPGNCQEVPNTTDVDDKDEIAIPARTALHQNTPNPFNPTTTIRFDLAHDAHVSLKIYDVAGRLVRALSNETMTAGYNRQVTWNGLDNAGTRVSSGVYFYRLVAGEYTATRKLVMMK